MEELIICVAPYPGEKQVEKFPGKLDVSDEVIRSYNEGASIAHLHVRDENGLQTIDTTLFKRDIESIHKHCTIIIEGSTGGAPEHTLKQRCVSFTVPGIEMGSLNLGSVNMFDGVYNNKIDDIFYYAKELKEKGIKPFMDCFDLSHFSSLPKLVESNLVSPPYTFGLVFDVPNGLPYSEKHLNCLLEELPEESIWFLALHHAKGAKAFMQAIELGGHVRVGYEDGPFLSSGERAKSNAELVAEVAKLAEQAGRKVVGPDRAREIIGIGKIEQ
ncbi:MAG: 3-keto-5-aminohexanoate cleavage protein [Spirochaetales bacterium]|nr:3-keto-5-aminohexanoate cleavage protein [Spirochaetales bacterium]